MKKWGGEAEGFDLGQRKLKEKEKKLRDERRESRRKTAFGG